MSRVFGQCFAYDEEKEKVQEGEKLNPTFLDRTRLIEGVLEDGMQQVVGQDPRRPFNERKGQLASKMH